MNVIIFLTFECMQIQRSLYNDDSDDIIGFNSWKFGDSISEFLTRIFKLCLIECIEFLNFEYRDFRILIRLIKSQNSVTT